MTRPALALCVLLAWALARSAPSRRQRAIAGALTALLGVDCARMASASWPVAHVALWCAFYAATSLGVTVVLRPEKATEQQRPADESNGGDHDRQGDGFPRHRGRLLLAVALASVATVGASFAAVRIGLTAELERGAFVAALCVQLLAATRFVNRGRAPDDAQTVALILAASSVADVAGAWWHGDPVRDWSVGKIQSLLTWAAIAAWEMRCLLRARTGST